MGYDEEQDASLAADWDIAVRVMEQFSIADRKLKRAGAIKLKRSNEGETHPSMDGIGRSFSNGRGAKPISDGRVRLAELTLEDLKHE